MLIVMEIKSIKNNNLLKKNKSKLEYNISIPDEDEPKKKHKKEKNKKRKSCDVCVLKYFSFKLKFNCWF